MNSNYRQKSVVDPYQLTNLPHKIVTYQVIPVYQITDEHPGNEH